MYNSRTSVEESIFAIIETSYAMLLEGYSTEQIIKLWESGDENKLYEVLESLDTSVLTEEIEIDDEDEEYFAEQLELIIERFGLGTILKRLGFSSLDDLGRAATKNPALKKQYERLRRMFGKKTPSTAPKTPSTTPKTPSTTSKTPPTSSTTNKPKQVKPPTPEPPKVTPSRKTGGRFGKWGRRAGVVGGLGLAGLGLIGHDTVKQTITGLTGGDNGNDDGGGGGGGSTTDGSTANEKDKETKTTKKDRTSPPKANAWWRVHGPGTKYRDDVSLRTYRNIRAHYEVVADYLISEGHADTLEEAEYVMSQLSEEHINKIIEQYENI